MNVMVTGHAGYIGAVLVPLLLDAGHEVVGVDTGLFETCTFGASPPAIPALRLDVRDAPDADAVAGFDACATWVLHEIEVLVWQLFGFSRSQNCSAPRARK